MTAYPNREHEVADKAAKRRAVKALDDITNEVTILRRKLDTAAYVDGDDTQILADRTRELTKNLAILCILDEVRDWHAADLASGALLPLLTTHQGAPVDARNNIPEEH